MIELENIVKKFDVHTVLNRVSFTFENGHSYAIIGESGSGKTTLLNIIGKLEEVDSGRVLVDTKPIDLMTEKDYFRNFIGYLFQNYGLIDNETIEQNLELAFVGRKLPKSEKRKMMLEMLKTVNLKQELSRKIFSLSGGEAQRVGIAKIMIKNPPIILADEPTAALDSENSEEIMTLLLNMKNENRIIIIATHNPAIWNMADEIIDLDTLK
ncbi:MAG: ABC transporter ATP-binding protein [Streptococcaceae bacterium]|jgi:putative ABC transport system ATP-binding protein|nr:ABC transporter ATP-binding protein [Streptococcaceae bacterium]